MNNTHYGFFNNDSNNIFTSLQGVYLTSSTSSQNRGLYIHPCNLRHCIALFSARSLSKHTWINDPDRYMGRENINE